MNRLKYILAASFLIALAGLTAAQVNNDTGMSLDNQTTLNDTNDSVLNGSNETGNATGRELNETGNVTLDTVILATTENYPDALVSAPAAEKLGFPVLLTDQDELSNSTSQLLDDANVSNVIIVGGPSVISEDVENQVEDDVNATTRLWGVTQVGTSAEIAGYFWTEADEATILQYEPYQNNNSYKLLAAAKEAASQDAEPLLVVGGNLSNSTAAALEDLGTNSVDIYSTDTSNQTNLTGTLEEMGVETQVNRGSINELTEELQANLTDNVSESVSLIAAPNSSDIVSVPAYPDGPSIGIYSEDQINDTLSLFNDTNISMIEVAGERNLAEQVESEASNMADTDVTLLVGTNAEMAAASARLNIESWAAIQEQAAEEFEAALSEQEQMLQNELEQQQTRLNEMQNATQEDENITDNQTAGMNTSDIEDGLNQAGEALNQGDYFMASIWISGAESELNKIDFMDMSPENINGILEQELGINQSNDTGDLNETNESQNLTQNNSDQEDNLSLGLNTTAT